VPLALWHPDPKDKLLATLLKHATGVFIDIGANIGQTLCTYVYSGSDMKYWGVEPNPDAARILRLIIENNQLTRCSILNCGLADTQRSGLLFFESGFSTDTRATIHPDIRPNREYNTLEISLYPFDVIRERYSIGRIGLIKIDVKGAELEVLRGMTLTLQTDRPPVICEVL